MQNNIIKSRTKPEHNVHSFINP
uniref:Uncharacterized protein n=1 Tax=Anguilla anguilla TaxID=7936 RepID=A0A0E9QT74_ANGAN